MSESGHLTAIGRRIIRASLVVGFAHLLLKLSSLVLAKAMAVYVAPGIYDVVYVVAFDACIFSFFLIGEEVVGPTFLPVFMREMDTRGEEAAWRFANVILTVHFLVLLAVTAAIMLFPGAIVRLCTVWNETASPERYALAKDSLARMAPSLICLSIGSTTYVILNSYKRFFLAAFGDAAWKICVVAFVLAGMGMLDKGYGAITAGLILGSAAKLLTHLCGLRREIRLFRPSVNLSNPAVKTMFMLMLPLLAGILFAKVRDVFNNVTVLSHLDTVGLMQANSFGRKLFQPIGWLIPYAISIAMFPFFCEMVDRNDHDHLGRVLSHSGRMLLSVFIPLALVCASLAYPIASLLFQGGKFTPQGVRWTAISMACYTLVLPASALEYLLLQAFFATRRTIAVTVIGIVFSMLSMSVSYGGIVIGGARGGAALAVIALGFSVTRTLKTAALVIQLKKSVPCFPLRETISFLARTVVVGAMTAGSCLFVQQAFRAGRFQAGGKMALLVELAACGAAALLGFVLSLRLLRVDEPAEMFAWATQRVRERFAR